MPHVIITATADADTADILAELNSKAGRAIAEKFNALFDSLYDRLADYPESGPLRPKLGRHIRVGFVLPYVVIYRHIESDDTLSIIRILHGRRRLTKALL
jgi:plasmid stabilization system protein ParE